MGVDMFLSASGLCHVSNLYSLAFMIVTCSQLMASLFWALGYIPLEYHLV